MGLRVLTGIIVVLIVALGFVAWKKNTAPAVPSQGAGSESAAPEGGGGAGGMAMPPAQDPGVAWHTPKRWAEDPASGMRLATYAVPAPPSGGEAARCAVYYFGPGQGGGTEDNIQRWIGEFENPSTPARRSFEVRGMKVSRVEVAGTYMAHAGMGGSESPSPGWTLLGAIVEGPQGALFFKLTGPTSTVSPAAKEFDGLLASLRKK